MISTTVYSDIEQHAYPLPVVTFYGLMVRYSYDGCSWEMDLYNCKANSLDSWVEGTLLLRNWCVINIHDPED